MWGGSLFFVVLNMSVTAGVAVVFVLAARLLLRRAPRVFSYMLWLVVLFRLICPVSFTSKLSLYQVFRLPFAAEGSLAYASSVKGGETADAGLLDIRNDAGRTTEKAAQEEAPAGQRGPEGIAQKTEKRMLWEIPETVWAMAAFYWIAGASAMLLYGSYSCFRLRRRLVGALRLRENIYISDYISSSFVLGGLRPRIYLPSDITEREQAYVILHEQTHIYRGDHLIKLLAFLVLCAHWFNPLIWGAFIYFTRDMEMSCDEAVVRKMGGGIRKAYCRSLLKLAAGPPTVQELHIGFGGGEIRERIRNLLDGRRLSPWKKAAAGIFTVCICFMLAGNPVQAAAQVAEKGETIGEAVLTGAENPDIPHFSEPDSKHFAKLLIDCVEQNHAEVLAQLVKYPISIETEGERIKIDTPEQFIQAYKRFMSAEMKKAVTGTDETALFHNQYGYMLDGGVMWFSEFGKEGFLVYAVNNLLPQAGEW